VKWYLRFSWQSYFQDATLHSLVLSVPLFRRNLFPVDGDSRFAWNTGIIPPGCTMLKMRSDKHFSYVSTDFCQTGILYNLPVYTYLSLWSFTPNLFWCWCVLLQKYIGKMYYNICKNLCTRRFASAVYSHSLCARKYLAAGHEQFAGVGHCHKIHMLTHTSFGGCSQNFGLIKNVWVYP
jgi:hypothetical protein